MKKFKGLLKSNLDFALASLAYIAAHIVDYLFTVPGIRNSAYSEGNPIIQGYIDHFGLEGGILGYKFLVCIALIVGMKAIDLARKKKQFRFRAEYILYGGAILTTSGGALWILTW